LCRFGRLGRFRPAAWGAGRPAGIAAGIAARIAGIAAGIGRRTGVVRVSIDARPCVARLESVWVLVRAPDDNARAALR
jgi:hypothetical protein